MSIELRLIGGKIFTIDNLQKQRIMILDWCCMRKSSGERQGSSAATELRSFAFVLFVGS